MSKVGAEYIKKKFNLARNKSAANACQMQGTRSAEEAEFTVVNEVMRHERNTAVGKQRLRILTHCNAGALATGGYGTALGVIRTLHEEGLVEMVYADETRPRQQGARLTVWELANDGIPVTLNTDNMVAHLMKQGLIDMVITGADRITANGDAANKIGTYGVAIQAKYHNIPFYVAAPESTIDRSLNSGDEIIIEERDSSEVSHINGLSCTTASGVSFVNPGFDVTPRELIEAIFTEKGIF
jgi:methylthioribose-1-phosphate isomerase